MYMIGKLTLFFTNRKGKYVIEILSVHEFNFALQRYDQSVRAKLIEIKNLLPFYDHNECVLRVGGRIVKSRLPIEAVHQYKLPKACYVPDMIAKYYHCTSHHFGANFALSQVLSKFWLCGGTSTIGCNENMEILNFTMVAQCIVAVGKKKLLGQILSRNELIFPTDFSWQFCRFCEEQSVIVQQNLDF